MRFQTRNAWHEASLQDVVMEASFPPQLRVVSLTLRVHDNPMDDCDPTPAELDHFGIVTELPGMFRVETPEVIERYFPGAPSPVPTFRDMMELDVLFEVPAGGLGEIGELVFGGVVVTANRLGVPKRGESGPLVIPVGPNAPPEEISLAEFGEPLRMHPDGRLSWDDEPTLGADRHGIFRGDIVEAWADFSISTCEKAEVGRPTEWSDDDNEVIRRPDRFPDRGGWFYLVRGSNCAGDGGLGLGSRGTARPTGAPCP